MKLLKEKKNNFYLYSFLLGALVYYMFLCYSQVAGGKYIILEGDSLEGFAASIKNFCENLWAGKGVFYSWSMFLGINTFVTNMTGIMLFSISMPFYLLLYKLDIAAVTVLVLVIKAGLCSLFSYMYFDKVLKINGIRAIVFSICYAMCAFQCAYIPYLLTFSDAVFMLPLILLLVTNFADNGKIRLMSVAYLYLFLNFYYPAYTIGFFSFFYLIVYMVFVKKYTMKTIISKLLIFGVSIVFTAGITAIVLYPTALFLMTKYADDATTIENIIGGNVLDIYNQLFMGENMSLFNRYPYVYCGLPVMFLLPAYILSKKIDIESKILYLSMLVLMVISCTILPLYLFWHCFDAPDGFYYRFTYIISFLLCVIGCKASERIHEIKYRFWAILILINLAIYVICMYVQPNNQMVYQSYSKSTWMFFGINAAYMLIYFGWLIIYNKKASDEKNKKALSLLFVLIISSELIINGYSAYYLDPTLLPNNNSDSYNLWVNSNEDALRAIEIAENDSTDFYRISSTNDYIMNAGLFFGYNGVSSFSNMENYEARLVLEALGVETSARDIFNSGLTDFTNSIFAVKYNIVNVDFGDHRDYVIDENQFAEVYLNNYCLSLGFLVSSDIDTFEFSGRNQFTNINELASCMIGNDVELYEIYTGDVENINTGVELVLNENGVYTIDLAPEEGFYGGIAFFIIPYEEREAYAQFDYGESVLDNKAPIIYDGVSGDFTEDERISASFIKKMSIIEEGYVIAVIMRESLYDSVYLPDLNTAYYNRDQFELVYDILKENQMNVIEYNNGYVHATINVTEENKTLFTSIPYDDGWDVYVNGEKTSVNKLLGGAFIGIDLPVGEYDIEFVYHVSGIKTGALISLVSLCLLLIWFKVAPNPECHYRKKKDKTKENESDNNIEETKNAEGNIVEENSAVLEEKGDKENTEE